LRRLLADLDSNQFFARDQAEKDLAVLAELAEPALRQALAGKASLELRRRLERLLDRIVTRSYTAEQLRELRSITVLEHMGTEEARQVLQHIAQGAEEATLTQEAKATLQRLTRRSRTSR
jgi:hypothetical protein